MNSVIPTFWQWFTSLDTGDLAGLSFLAGCCLVAVTLIVSMTVYFPQKIGCSMYRNEKYSTAGFDAEGITLAVHGTPRTTITDSKITDPFHALKVKQ